MMSGEREILGSMEHPQSARYPSIDLFSGAGGLTLGLHEAGFSTVAAAEVDANAITTFTAAHRKYSLAESLSMYTGDIKDHSFQSLRGNIAVVAGGPPCQPYSLGGLRRGSADQRDGIPHFLRAVKEVNPEAFLMENVPGLATRTNRVLLNRIIGDLSGLGFNVTYKVLRAADFGVCQRRQRLFIVGTKSGGFNWPEPTHGSNASKPWVKAGDLLNPSTPIGPPNTSIVTYARRPDLRPSPWDGHLWNGGGRPINPEGQVPTLLASMGGNKTPWLDGSNIVTEYHAHLLKGGAPRSGAVPGARRLTVREAALVQTFPADMPWAGPSSSQYRQIGNAVPVKLASAVSREVIKCL